MFSFSYASLPLFDYAATIAVRFIATFAVA